MSENIIWIASRDGTGWSSNRTRDKVDVAFTVRKATDHEDPMVIIRKPNRDGDASSRATVEIGRVYFETVEQAKEYVSKILDDVNSDATIDMQDARKLLLKSMLDASKANTKGRVYYDYTYHSKPQLVVTPVDHKLESWMNVGSDISEAVAILEESAAPTVEPISAEEVTEIFNKVISLGWSPEEVGTPTPVEPVFDTYLEVETTEEFDVAAHVESLPLEIDLSEGDTYVAPTAEDMAAMVEEVQEAVEPVVIQEPKVIVINGKEMVIGWPK